MIRFMNTFYLRSSSGTNRNSWTEHYFAIFKAQVSTTLLVVIADLVHLMDQFDPILSQP